MVSAQAIEVAGQVFRLFVETPPLIQAMVADIRQARVRVWLESYIFQDDLAGVAMAEALMDRARAGLDVRLLYDAVGSQWTSRGFIDQLIRAGVQVHAFHSFWEALWRLEPLTILNRRNHRKILVIDQSIAYFGGMNITNTAQADRIPPYHRHSGTGWRDVHARMQGPRQAEIAESFLRSWNRGLGKAIPRRNRAYRKGLLPTSLESLRFFDSGPGLRYSRASRVFVHLIDRATESITISMAYFLPAGPVLRALLAARRRGVKIRIVVPGSSDVPLVQAATTHLYSSLLRRGFRIYERNARMLHSKVLVVDRQWSLIGSCNMDPRSFWINFEFLGVIRSPTLAAALQAICQAEIRQSRRITRLQIRLIPWHRRLINRLAWSLRWWL